MADVFISYAREDRAVASALAGALERRGWSVWWDREILAGESFDVVIGRELATARAVVVLWSAQSVDSEWVKNEAADAAARGVLVPAVLDGAKLPLEFRRRQAADLGGWRGEAGHEGFSALCQGVAAKVAPPAKPAPVVAAPRGAQTAGRHRALALVVVLLAIGGAVYAWRSRAVAPPPAAELADLVTGTYAGGVYSDARGHAQSDVTVTVTKLGPRRVRVSADYDRLRTVDIDVTRVLDDVMASGGGVTFMLEPSGRLTFSPDGEVSYQGMKRR